MKLAASEINLIGGNFNVPVTAVSANYTVGADDYVILGTGGTSGITVTLPSAVTNKGRMIVIAKVDSGAGAVTIAAPSGQTINGAANISVGTQWTGKKCISNGSNWIAI